MRILAEPVQLGDHQRFAIPDLGQQSGELRALLDHNIPIDAGIGKLVVDLVPGLLDLKPLVFHRLLFGTYPTICKEL